MKQLQSFQTVLLFQYHSPSNSKPGIVYGWDINTDIYKIDQNQSNLMLQMKVVASTLSKKNLFNRLFKNGDSSIKETWSIWVITEI